jgi:heme-degrading monooxygenase HmoA
VRKWRTLQKHRAAQKAGRERIFESSRLRIASVVRDYTMDERKEAPKDSVEIHG